MTARLCPDCGDDLDALGTLCRRCPPCRKAHRTRQKLAWAAAHPDKVRESDRARYARQAEARREEREHLAALKARREGRPPPPPTPRTAPRPRTTGGRLTATPGDPRPCLDCQTPITEGRALRCPPCRREALRATKIAAVRRWREKPANRRRRSRQSAALHRAKHPLRTCRTCPAPVEHNGGYWCPPCRVVAIRQRNAEYRARKRAAKTPETT